MSAHINRWIGHGTRDRFCNTGEKLTLKVSEIINLLQGNVAGKTCRRGRSSLIHGSDSFQICGALNMLTEIIAARVTNKPASVMPLRSFLSIMVVNAWNPSDSRRESGKVLKYKRHHLSCWDNNQRKATSDIRIRSVSNCLPWREVVTYYETGLPD